MSTTRSDGTPLKLLAIAVLAALGALLLHRIYFENTGSHRLVGNRSLLAPGACIEYSPSSGNNHHTVFLDAGHGGPDPGTEGTGPHGGTIFEKNITLPVVMETMRLLTSNGYHVVLSRNADQGVARTRPGYIAGGSYTAAGAHAETAARAACANAARAQLLLSVHMNAYADPSVGGVETAYDPDRPFSAQNRRFATLVQSAVLHTLAAKGWSLPDRGVQPDTAVGTPALTAQGAAYGHLMILGPALRGWFDNPSRMPGALCEPLFLTDPGEAAVAVSSSGRRALADAFATAVEKYFGTP